MNLDIILVTKSLFPKSVIRAGPETVLSHSQHLPEIHINIPSNFPFVQLAMYQPPPPPPTTKQCAIRTLYTSSRPEPIPRLRKDVTC
jgi:hypothetical protein